MIRRGGREVGHRVDGGNVESEPAVDVFGQGEFSP